MPSGCGSPHTKKGLMSNSGRTRGTRSARLRRRAAARRKQIEQQRRDHRTVHDQARIPLDLGDVAAVVVDAMTVERQRRIAEQQHVVRHPVAFPCAWRGRSLGRRRDVIGLGRLAINDVVELGERERPARRCAVISCRTLTNTSVPVRPIFSVTSCDRRHAREVIADAQRLVEFELAARPHPTRQRHRRQKAAALGVAVRSRFPTADAAAGSRASATAAAAACRRRSLGRAVQRRRQRRIGRRGGRVFHGLGLADPVGRDRWSSMQSCADLLGLPNQTGFAAVGCATASVASTRRPSSSACSVFA